MSRNAAIAIGRLDELGTVEAGKLADLVILDGDPLDDPYDLLNVRVVIQGGRNSRRQPLGIVHLSTKPIGFERERPHEKDRVPEYVRAADRRHVWHWPRAGAGLFRL